MSSYNTILLMTSINVMRGYKFYNLCTHTYIQVKSITFKAVGYKKLKFVKNDVL